MIVTLQMAIMVRLTSASVTPLPPNAGDAESVEVDRDLARSEAARIEERLAEALRAGGLFVQADIERAQASGAADQSA
jgi:hypothetical protein